jgi:hypothetical protein
VIAVGQRVFVNCPGDRTGTVLLEDESGKIPSTVHLTDGVVVEVVAWRPRGTGDARYRVRRASDGADGWVNGDSLRKTAVPDPVAPQPAPAPEAATPRARSFGDDGARPFGQRSHPGYPPELGSSRSSLLPEPADDGGKRFGRR